ncbi:MAG: RsmB/NOP family class I SAM-dependent RNA methyltransferase [Kiritimatiellia bacterium]
MTDNRYSASEIRPTFYTSPADKADDGTLSRMDALRILEEWMNTEAFPDRMFGRVPPFRRGFVMDLVYTTVRNIRLLSFVTDSFLKADPDRPYVRAALFLGAAQLLLMDDIADYAGVSSTVEALKRLSGASCTGFVNAVLRNLLRNPDKVARMISDAPLAVRESHTDEQVARWSRNFGSERAEAICKWDNTAAGVTVLSLPNPVVTAGEAAGEARYPSVAELLVSFREAGVQATLHPRFKTRALCLPHGSHVDKLPGFSEGLFSIQDPATLEAVRLLDVHPGQRVLDACAAPGGKTIQLAALMARTGELIAMDCWTDRVALMRENFRRFRLDRFIRAGKGDAKRVRLADFDGKRFDRILADVPCSNTGVQRRRVDARWRFDAKRLSELTEVQAAILENLATLLAPGGRLVYSTCSIEPEENRQIVQAFLRTHSDFRLAEDSALIPPDSGCDGAYAAALVYEPEPTHSNR